MVSYCERRKLEKRLDRTRKNGQAFQKQLLGMAGVGASWRQTQPRLGRM